MKYSKILKKYRCEFQNCQKIRQKSYVQNFLRIWKGDPVIFNNFLKNEVRVGQLELCPSFRSLDFRNGSQLRFVRATVKNASFIFLLFPLNSVCYFFSFES